MLRGRKRGLDAWNPRASCCPRSRELGVELIEQPLLAADVEGLRALREVRPRPALVVDEGCHDLRDVASAASWADGKT